MKKSVKHASIEEILHDVCYYEDPDTTVHVNTTEDAKVFVSDNEWGVCVVEDTMKKALIRFQLKKWESWGNSKERIMKDAEEFKELDWSSAIAEIIKEP